MAKDLQSHSRLEAFERIGGGTGVESTTSFPLKHSCTKPEAFTTCPIFSNGPTNPY